jgi:MoxR-like ATPase
MTAEELLAAQRAVRAVYVSAPLLDYIQAIVARTRSELPLGLSPRAAQGLVRGAQAWALLAGERAVLPEHVQAVLPSVAAHRLERRDATSHNDPMADGARIVSELIGAVPVPV